MASTTPLSILITTIESTNSTRADLLANQFGWEDYLVFSLMLIISAAIGVYYGFFANKKNDTKEFLMAGKSMTTFPIAMSLIAR